MYSIKVFWSCCIIGIVSCNNKEVIPLDKTDVNKKENKMDSIVEFSDLFNEGTIIKFTPKDIQGSENEIRIFRDKLLKYERQHIVIEDFIVEDLENLINNETFFDTQYYIDSSWLEYFINKYKIGIDELVPIMKTAILYEDYSAVKVLINQGYIVSRKEKNIVKETLENRRFNIEENKKAGYEIYLVMNSKIEDISKIIDYYYLVNYIYDKDGYTNLRRGKGTSTEIIQQIKSGESVEVLDNSGEWYLVKTKEGKEGYVHKSRVKPNISKPISMSLYSHPDWNSFSQDIRVEEEIKYIHKVSGWDYVKIGDQLGYLPPVGEEKPIKKHSFLVEDDPLPKKEKGFWDKLFG